MSRSDKTEFWRGTVPWDVDEVQDVMEWYGRLKDTPKDDWNLTWDWGLNLVDGDSGLVQRLRMNPFVGMNQLMMHLRGRYGPEEASSHGYRFWQIGEFLEDNHDQLREDELIRDSDDGQWEVKEELLRALCTLPFSRMIGNGPAYTFDYDEVVELARRFEKETGKDDKE